VVRYFVVRGASLVILTLGCLLVFQNKVHALDRFWADFRIPNASSVTPGFDANCMNSLNYQNSLPGPMSARTRVNNSGPYSGARWISYRGFPAANVITEPHGSTAAIPLQFNNLTFVCAILVNNNNGPGSTVNDWASVVNSSNYPNDRPPNSPSAGDKAASLYRTRSRIESASVISGGGSLSGSLNGSIIDTTRDNGSRYWFSPSLDFNYNPDTSLTGPRTVVIRFNVRGLHVYHSYNGTPQCRNNSGSIINLPSLDSFNSCALETVDVSFNINVSNPKHYDLYPSFTVDTDNNTVNFTVENSRDGLSRQSNGEGVEYRRSITVNGVSVYSNTSSVVFGPNTVTSNPVVIGQALNPGDIICPHTTVNPSTGITDGATTVGIREYGNGNPGTCVTVVAKPYFRVYGSDVVVGKNFVDSSGVCPAGKNPNASINTFSMDRPGVGWVGSGAQFAVSATGTISSFISASMHNGVTSGTGVPFPANGIYFGNGSNPTPGGNDQNGYAGCLPDYERYVANNGGFPAPANRSISQSDISSSTATQIFVDGDITITGTGIRSDINDTTAFGSIADIKPVVVIARGNINIEPGVDNLYGLYVALPRADSTGGTINTCYTGGSPTIACNNTLTVNGSFVANKVELNRLAGDIRNATANEDDTSTNIAEKFIVTPEFYLSFTNVHNSSQDANSVGQYRSLVGLPPVL